MPLNLKASIGDNSYDELYTVRPNLAKTDKLDQTTWVDTHHHLLISLHMIKLGSKISISECRPVSFGQF